MNPAKEIEWWLRELWLSPRVWRRYRTLRPHKVALPDVDAQIHIDPSDRRARKKLLYDPLRGRTNRNVRFWRDFCATLEPDLALDIGANYGECIFSTDYGCDRADAFR